MKLLSKTISVFLLSNSLQSNAIAVPTVPSFEYLMSHFTTFVSDTFKEFTQDPHYAPDKFSCTPDINSGKAVRFIDPSNNPHGKTDGLGYVSKLEKGWIKQRDIKAQSTWRTYLTNLELKDLDMEKVLKSGKLPRIGMAASGGGSRAMAYTTSIMKLFDAREKKSLEKKTGGIMQISSYLVGLSGSSWLVAGLLAYNNPKTGDYLHTKINLKNSMYTPGDNATEVVSNLAKFNAQISTKSLAGYPVGFTDAWGRVASYQVLHGLGEETGYGLNFRLSDFAHDKNSAFYNYDIPFPIMIGSEHTMGENMVAEGRAWEFSPLEIGSVHPNVSAYVDTRFFGSAFEHGKPKTKDCVQNFDQLGYIMGISSAAFGTANPTNDENVPEQLKKLAKKFNFVEDTMQDVTLSKVNNPFVGLDKQSRNSSNSMLYFADGAFSPLGNLPTYPLHLPERKVDINIVIEATNDEGNYPNGSALLIAADYAKSLNLPHPKIPTFDEFADKERKLLKKITFFGCSEPNTPIIVYLPNHEVSFPTNKSIYDFTYTTEELDGFYKNTEDIAYGVKGDGDFPTCLGCLMVAFAEHTSEQCDQCMAKYCWDKTFNVNKMNSESFLLRTDLVLTTLVVLFKLVL